PASRGEGIRSELAAGRGVGAAATAARARRSAAAARAAAARAAGPAGDPFDREAVDVERHRARAGARAAGVQLDADLDRLRRIVPAVLGHRAVDVDRELLPVVVLANVGERPAEDVLVRHRDDVDL